MQVQIYIPPYKFQTCPLQGNYMPLLKGKCFSKAILRYSRWSLNHNPKEQARGLTCSLRNWHCMRPWAILPFGEKLFITQWPQMFVKQFCSSSMHSYRGFLTPQLSNVSENVLEPTDYQSTLLAQSIPPPPHLVFFWWWNLLNFIMNWKWIFLLIFREAISLLPISNKIYHKPNLKFNTNKQNKEKKHMK